MTTLAPALRRPNADEYYSYYETYVRLVGETDLLQQAADQIGELTELFAGVSEADAMVVHPPYTWTIKQVVGHLIDAERIFSDRLHRFASGDLQELPGMEQDPYVANQDYQTPALRALLEELLLCRRANLLLMKRLLPHAWDQRGVASGHPVTVRALAWIMVGHITYHLRIVRQRLQGARDGAARSGS